MGWDRKAPWESESGSLIVYVGPGGREEGIDWRSADEPFEATITFTGFERGRSAAQAVFDIEGTNDGSARMFLKDIEDMVMAGRKFEKTMSGQWVVVKRGANFGIRMANLG